METLLHFVQSIYLVFASIYVLKESIEHALLEGSDEVHIEDDAGLVLPTGLLLAATAFGVFSSLVLHNHAKLVAGESGVRGSALLPSLTRPLSLWYLDCGIRSTVRPSPPRTRSFQLRAGRPHDACRSVSAPPLQPLQPHRPLLHRGPHVCQHRHAAFPGRCA